MLNSIEKAIQTTLQNIGININNEDMDIPLDVLIQDSITYVTFIVELERELQIEIPDEFLQMDTIQTLNELTAMVSTLEQQEMV